MELNPLLQHFVDVGFRVAEDQFKEGKDVCPQITLLAEHEDEDGLTVVPIISTADILGRKDSTRVVPGLVRMAWEGVLKERPQLKLLAITVMADTWIETRPLAEVKAELAAGGVRRPSQRVGSTEAIIVQLTIGEEDCLFQWPYVKSGNEVVFSGKPEKNEEMGGFIRGLWPL